MERAAFLLEDTGQRIPCLLNPGSIVVRRLAGVKARQSSAGPLTGAALKDDPLVYTGGGMTEILLDLLFDVSLAGSTGTAADVRDLTRPLTELAEGKPGDDGYGQTPLVRFVWGKAWNVLGVVAAVAERLEWFTEGGEPQRSWLRMRFLRASAPAKGGLGRQERDLSLSDVPKQMDVAPESLRFHQVEGAGAIGESGAGTIGAIGESSKGGQGSEAGQGSGGGRATQRLDEIAATHYGNPAWWRLIAVFNNIDNPSDIPAGSVLNIPPDSALGART
jgi:hypothetical protein